MRKKMIRNLSTLALSAIIAVSAFAPIAHAAEHATYATNTCTECGSYDISELYRDVDPQMLDAYQHVIYLTIHYECNNCPDDFRFHTSEVIVENHDYELDETTGLMTCSGCGDSYYW